MIGLLIFSVGITSIPESFACSCAIGTFEESIGYSDVVIIGTAQSVINESDRNLTWEFSDVVYVKGEKQNDQLMISTPNNSAACGYNFESQKEYLIFISEHDENLTTGLCNGNLLTSELTENQIQILSDLQVSNVDFRTDAGEILEPGDSTGEHVCDDSEFEINGCVPSELVISGVLLIIAGISGFVIIRKMRQK